MLGGCSPERIIMHSLISCRMIVAGIVVTFLATTPFAQTRSSSRPPASSEAGAVAIITMVSNAELRVNQLQLTESPGGQWITRRPNRFAAELYYRIQKDGVTINRAIPFGAIDSIEFTAFVAKDALNPEVRKMSVKLRDGGSIEWAHSDTSLTTTNHAGQREKWKSFPWITGVVSSGQQEQGNDYVISGFTGLVNINGGQSKWDAPPADIKRIRFVDGK